MNWFSAIALEWKNHTWYGKIGFVFLFPFGFCVGVWCGIFVWLFEVLERIENNQRDL